MRIDILTLFPGMFVGLTGQSIIKRALEAALVEIELWDIRDYCLDKHHSADDYPFGGGAGMLLKPEPLYRLLEQFPDNAHVVHLTPAGEPLKQKLVTRLATAERLVLLCGHYEGIDQRVVARFVHQEVSIGDYILSGGELPAMVLADAVVRLIPGVLGSSLSLQQESFTTGLLEYPQYTRPTDLRGDRVPELLRQGDHGAIARWQRKESIRRTLQRRPDLLLTSSLNKEDRKILLQLLREEGNNHASHDPTPGKGNAEKGFTSFQTR
ncbi:MAG: tRNA (guanosine(37)-N1)-methyltransferase TrmD [Symbiobacteriaceae bacterium]|nr:tRNA (guanosine(37)-N1)-methyltransferase TrmD [Symbiobacteriaceae bacterium]